MCTHEKCDLRFVILSFSGGSGTRLESVELTVPYHGIKEFRIKAKTRSRVEINAFEPCSDFCFSLSKFFANLNGKSTIVMHDSC